MANNKDASQNEEQVLQIGEFVVINTDDRLNSEPIDCGCDEMGPDCCDDVCGCDTD